MLGFMSISLAEDSGNVTRGKCMVILDNRGDQRRC